MKNICLKTVVCIEISLKAHSLVFVMQNHVALSVFPIKIDV